MLHNSEYNNDYIIFPNGVIMKLEDVLNFPLGYIYMERFIDKREYSPFCEYSEVDERYRTSSDHDSFDLPSFLVPRERCSIFLADPSKNLRTTYDRDTIPFRFHPELLGINDDQFIELKRCKEGKAIPVVPTSSTRTVLSLAVPPHFIKLHLPKRISRFNRRLRTSSVEYSVSISRDLEKVTFNQFAYLPETIGIAYDRNGGFGFLVREISPRPLEQDRFLIPYFSLYSQDTKKSGDKPLLVQMIDLRGEDPTSFVLEKILSPLIRAWCVVLKERGILLESHGQNVLLEIDHDLNPNRVVHRDFQSSMVNPSIRVAEGLDNPFKKHLIGVDGYFTREQEYSLVYDYLIGHHLFDSL